MPIVRLAKQLGWTVTVFDHRPAYAANCRVAAADAVYLTDYEYTIEGFDPLEPLPIQDAALTELYEGIPHHLTHRRKGRQKKGRKVAVKQQSEPTGAY